MSKARSWSNTPPCKADGGQDMAAVLLPGEEGGYQLEGELTSGRLIGYQGNQQRGAPLTAPLIKYPTGDSSDLKD